MAIVFKEVKPAFSGECSFRHPCLYSARAFFPSRNFLLLHFRNNPNGWVPTDSLATLNKTYMPRKKYISIFLLQSIQFWLIEAKKDRKRKWKEVSTKFLMLDLHPLQTNLSTGVFHSKQDHKGKWKGMVNISKRQHEERLRNVVIDCRAISLMKCM